MSPPRGPQEAFTFHHHHAPTHVHLLLDSSTKYEARHPLDFTLIVSLSPQPPSPCEAISTPPREQTPHRHCRRLFLFSCLCSRRVRHQAPLRDRLLFLLRPVIRCHYPRCVIVVAISTLASPRLRPCSTPSAHPSHRRSAGVAGCCHLPEQQEQLRPVVNRCHVCRLREPRRHRPRRPTRT